MEMPYEVAPRKRPRPQPTETHIQSLPIKLASGRIQQTGHKVLVEAATNVDETDEEESSGSEPEQPSFRVEDVATGARFGRPSVIDVIGKKSRAARVQSAKEQIAEIYQEIVAEPENGVR